MNPPYTPYSDVPSLSDQRLIEEIAQLRLEKQQQEALIRQQQATIEAGEQRWKFALEGVGDAIWEYNLQTDAVFRSARLYDILGYTATEFPHTIQGWRDLLHPQDQNSTLLEDMEGYRLGRRESHTVEYRLRAADGSYKHFLDRGRLFSHSPDGQPLLVVGTSTDITHQKCLEETLRNNANRQSNLIANLQEGILLEDERRTIVLVNQHFCQLFSIPVSPDQLKGMDCSGMAEQSKDFFLEPDAFVARVSHLLLEQKPVIGEELQLADGRIFTRDYVPIFLDNIYTGHLWKYADITPRKRAEAAAMQQKEKYQRIIENMNLGLIEVDLNDRIVYTNQSFCAMSGYEADELVGNIAIDILLKGQNVEFMKKKNDSRLTGTIDAYEVAIKNKRGEAMWWLISGAPLYSDSGEVIGSTGIHLDITNQKQLESDLRIAKQEAEDSSRAKELFLANMSHEIRTPMNAVLSLGQLLTKSVLTDHQQFLLGMINTAASNLLVIINDILDFSKIEAGQLSLEHVDFSLADLMQQAVQVLAYKAAEKNLDLSLTIDPAVAPVLMGDPLRLNQILLNLIGNAIKFTETGGVRIDCRCQTHYTRQVVTITVTDTGIGMDADFLKNLFTKFTQEDSSVGRRYGGTGLGMSITRQLVDLMGGTIGVMSEKNQGTAFTITLTFPVGPAHTVSSQERTADGDDILTGKRILLVEDNAMNRLIVSTILNPYGVLLTEVTNGLDAVEAIRNASFDLVLMDVQMPIMDGLQATRIIRADQPAKLPIIALTASVIRREEEACYAVGMNDFLAKPFNEDSLIRTLTKWLTCGTNDLQPAPAVVPKPLYDLSNLETISRGNPDFVRRMIDLFCTDAPDTLAKLQEAYQLDEYKKIKYLAHRIKPSIDSLNILDQKVAVRRIEELADTETNSEELRLLLISFDSAINTAIEHLRALYPAKA